MEVLLQGLVGGVIPTVLMIIVYFGSMAGRLSKIETNICWLKKLIEECLLHSKDRLR